MKLTSIFAAISLFACGGAVGVIQPVMKAFEPGTVHISSNFGGLSHIAWTLEIGKVLAERGHNVSFITDDQSAKFGKPYLPEIKTISLGPNPSRIPFKAFFSTDTPLPPSVVNALRDHISDTYKYELDKFVEIFKNSNTSIAICDAMSIPCVDAARLTHTPLMVHMTMSAMPDASAPFINPYHLGGHSTTKDISLGRRFYNRYIVQAGVIARYLPLSSDVVKIRRDNGVDARPSANLNDALNRHSNAVKLINNFWGVEAPRPVGPLVEYVGPIIGTSYDALPESLSKFMDEHDKVVYIAFGQTYHPNGLEFETLLKGLLQAYESGYFNGFVWSLSKSSREQPDLPKQVTTESGKVYIVQDLFDGKYGADMRFETWSPQFAILNHANCKLFISHGGASSIHESLYNGVPLLLHPFSSDQPQNAHTLQDSGVGLVLNRKAHDVADVVEKMRFILEDKTGSFKSNIDTMQSLAHLKSRRKVYAADLIEEVMYTVRNKDDIWYRREADEHMNFFKARNLDVDLFALFVLTTLVYLARKTFHKICIVLGFLFVPPTKKMYKTA